MSSETAVQKFKPGFGAFLAFGAAAAGSALAAVITPLVFAALMSITAALKSDHGSFENAFAVLFITGGFVAFFTFIFSFAPNFMGMCAIINAALSRKSGPLYYSGNKFLLAGAGYGLFVLFLSVCFMGAYTNKGGIGELFKSSLFFSLIPAAAFSGILNFKIASGIVRSALNENPKVKIDVQ